MPSVTTAATLSTSHWPKQYFFEKTRTTSRVNIRGLEINTKSSAPITQYYYQEANRCQAGFENSPPRSDSD